MNESMGELTNHWMNDGLMNEWINERKKEYDVWLSFILYHYS